MGWQMSRLLVLFAVAAGLSGCASSPFSHHARLRCGAGRQPYYQPGVPRSQFECMTDDGYGRSHPCSNKS